VQDTQSRYERLLEEVNQLQLNLKNVTAELQQARSQERFLCEEKEQLQNNLRDFENNNQSQFQRVSSPRCVQHEWSTTPHCVDE
jgi:DNA repair exonuclease SbcCD ATPase subunit